MLESTKKSAPKWPNIAAHAPRMTSSEAEPDVESLGGIPLAESRAGDSGGASGFRSEGDLFHQDPSANLRIAVEAYVSIGVFCGGKTFRETNLRGRTGHRYQNGSLSVLR